MWSGARGVTLRRAGVMGRGEDESGLRRAPRLARAGRDGGTERRTEAKGKTKKRQLRDAYRRWGSPHASGSRRFRLTALQMKGLPFHMRLVSTDNHACLERSCETEGCIAIAKPGRWGRRSGRCMTRSRQCGVWHGEPEPTCCWWWRSRSRSGSGRHPPLGGGVHGLEG